MAFRIPSGRWASGTLLGNASRKEYLNWQKWEEEENKLDDKGNTGKERWSAIGWLSIEVVNLQN